MWFGERQIRSFAWRDKLGSVLGDSDVGFLDVFDGLDLESGLVLLALVAAVALVVLPLVFFGVELIILGCLLAVGVLGRSLFGKPWTVAATRGREEVPAALWRVKGWRASGELISQICVDLEARGQLASEFPQAAYVERVDDSATRL
jgi:hypothetical protein